MKTVYLPKPMSAYDPRPELWECNGSIYLMYAPYVVSSKVVSNGMEDGMYRCTTRNSVYVFDWAPTIREVTKSRLKSVRDLI